jgi:tRNA A37 threonylcarbamoyladenosine synthetase subunit TsaC/SUA5/YrdC
MSPLDAAEHVVAVIARGGLAMVALDVSYAFLAGDRESLQRIFELKLRPTSRPCPILASWEQFMDVTKGSDVEIEKIKRVVDAGLPVGVITEPNWQSEVARSIPADCIDLLSKDGRLAFFMNMGGMSEELIASAARQGILLFGSSANISGQGNSFSISDVPEAMLEKVDVVCEAGECKFVNSQRLASTIVDLHTGELIRRGVLHSEIKQLFVGQADARDATDLSG